MSSKGVAIVTGCASARGIGSAIALRLASDGYDVALNDLPARKEELEILSKKIQGQFPDRKTLILEGDVSDEEFVRGLVDQTVQVLGGLDVMVANAGLGIVRSFLDVPISEFDKTVALNLRGTFLCFQNAARVMIARGKGGRIIGSSSVTGKQGSPFFSVYSTTKAGIRGLTQAVASELGRHGITVNSYAPGVIDTDMLHFNSQVLQKVTGGTMSYTDMAQQMTKLGRIGQPEEIANWVSFIASDQASYITGQTSTIDGGMYFD